MRVPIETGFWEIHQEESTFSDFCHYTLIPPADMRVKVAQFLQIHFIKDYNPEYQGFIHFCEKNCYYNGLPYTKRPIENADEIRKAKLAEKAAKEKKEGTEKAEPPAVICSGNNMELEKRELSMKEAMDIIFAERDLQRKSAREKFEKREQGRKQAESKESVSQEMGGKIKPKVQKDIVTMQKIRASKIDNLQQQYTSLIIYKKNYYITANRFRTPYTRGTNQLFGLSNIVIDIDYHGRWGHKITPEEICAKLNRLMCKLECQFFPLFDFYSPNSVVFTGRGLQLW